MNEPKDLEFRVGMNNNGSGKGQEENTGIIGFYLVNDKFIKDVDEFFYG